MTDLQQPTTARLLTRGRHLEVITLAWSVAGIVVVAAALRAGSIALGGFGLDNLIAIGASIIVLWELADAHHTRQQQALNLIVVAFAALAAYLAVQSSLLLSLGDRPGHSYLGIAWTALTAAVMFALALALALALARCKALTGVALGNPVLQTEGKVTAIDGILALAVLAGLALNAAIGWLWADPASSYALVLYGAREARHTHS